MTTRGKTGKKYNNPIENSTLRTRLLFKKGVL